MFKSKIVLILPFLFYTFSSVTAFITIKLDLAKELNPHSLIALTNNSAFSIPLGILMMIGCLLIIKLITPLYDPNVSKILQLYITIPLGIAALWDLIQLMLLLK